MSTTTTIRDELLAYSPADPVIADVLERAWTALATTPSVLAHAEHLPEGEAALQLALLNPATASPELRASKYFTGNCQALRSEALIVVNEAFLLELEAAVRSLAQSETLLSSLYLRSDLDLFTLVRRVSRNPERQVERLRRHAQRAGTEAEETIRKELAMVVLFFLGHELGHLASGHEAGSFGAFIDPDAPLQNRIEDAVINLCRHVDEFIEMKFGLDGFGKLADQTSEPRSLEVKFREPNAQRFAQQEAFFQNEAIADEWAARIVVDHLVMIETHDAVADDYHLYLMVRGVFAAALFSWYRDLDVFARKLGIPAIADLHEFGFMMFRDREQYVYAASLFGEYHRFTMLRAALAIEAVLRARTHWFEQPGDQREIGNWIHDVAALKNDADRQSWWLSESLRRYYLLCIMMDTAVKLSHMGCSSAWARNADVKRGFKQLFMMNYETIEEAVARLRRFA